MPLNRFAVKDGSHAAFGRLIKDWALEREKRPTCIKEFLDALERRGIGFDLPWGCNVLTELNLFVGVPERLDIRLPPPSFIEESEEYLKKNGYPLPRYYQDLFQTEPKWGDTPEEAIAFHDARVGDYTVANCA